MAKTGSYIKLDRGLKNNSLWLEKPFSKGQAWVDLLILAQGVNREKEYRGQVQRMEKGKVYTSILYLARRWGWGRTRVYRFLDTLISLGMIAVQGWTQNDTTNRTRNGTTNGTIITIENWAFYQGEDANNDTPNDTTDRTQNDTHNRKQYRESNTEKANKKKSLRSDSPSGMKPRGEGTVADIPARYRKTYKTYADYWDARNQ